MKNSIIIFIIGILLAVLPDNILAAVIHVPSDQPTIQDGIETSVNGDTVIVAAGTYFECLDFVGKSIIVASQSGAYETVIDGGCRESSVVKFINGEISSSILKGFTVQQGCAEFGGGIYCYNTSPTIAECIISNNHADSDGGGFFCTYYSEPTISDCTFSMNYAGWGGGAIYFNNRSTGYVMHSQIVQNTAGLAGGGIYCNTNSYPQISNCEIRYNAAEYFIGSGICCGANSSPFIFGCLFYSNTGRGTIACIDSSSPILVNCTVSGNYSDLECAGLFLSDIAFPIVLNCIFWDNNGEICGDGNPLISYSDIQGYYEGIGNIDADPMFIAGSNGAFYLSQIDAGQSQNSPCLDIGSDWSINVCLEVLGNQICMSDLTTRTDKITDTGRVDMGFHYLSSSNATPTPTPTITPSPTATPTPIMTLGVMIDMPHYIHPGEKFWVTGKLINSIAPLKDIPVFFIFQMYSSYWYWPSWSYNNAEGHGDIDYKILNIPLGITNIEIVRLFEWIDTGTDQVSNLWFWGAMLNPELTEIIGDWDVINWSYGPQ